MKLAINRKVENERAGFDAMDCNLTCGTRQEDWWNAGWPTPQESAQDSIDFEFAVKRNGHGKGKGPGNGMQFGVEGVRRPMQTMMAAISAMKGGATGLNNKCNNPNGGIKGGKGGKD